MAFSRSNPSYYRGVTSARWIAFQTLVAVESGAFADEQLERRAAGLDSRDAGLATQIVYGVLRRKAQLDWAIARQAPGRKLEPEVRVALEIGVFQRLFLERIPAHAAVSESVEMVRAARKASAAGLVNAVLRRMNRVPEWPDRAVALSMPQWLLERWDHAFGEDAATLAALAALEPPEECWRGERRMDTGAQKVAELVAARPGELVLDLCAAPGNKTAILVETGARVIAADISPRRILDVGPAAARVLLDASQSLPFRQMFDWALADVPCSGTGTLGRNPEIKWRLQPSDLVRQAARQQAILEQALACLKPGGRLVYATCSLESEENQEVVERVAGARVQRVMTRLPGRDRGDGFQAYVISSEGPAND